MADPTPWNVAEDRGDVRKHAPATVRNREAIAAVLVEELAVQGLILEIASGSGEHVAHFAGEFPGHTWQPSDPDASGRASIAAWCEGLSNVLPPLDLDAASADWPIDRADAVLCINMVHISPWQATLGLVAGAARLLPRGAPLILYGPFLREGVPLAPSNAAFDESLKSRDPRWGLRSVEAIRDAALGFALDRIVEMPANNLTLVFRRV
jgi:hypothetical protein